MPKKTIVTDRYCNNCGENLVVITNDDGSLPTNKYGRIFGTCLTEGCPDQHQRIAISPEHMPKEA